MSNGRCVIIHPSPLFDGYSNHFFSSIPRSNLQIPRKRLHSHSSQNWTGPRKKQNANMLAVGDRMMCLMYVKLSDLQVKAREVLHWLKMGRGVRQKEGKGSDEV